MKCIICGKNEPDIKKTINQIVEKIEFAIIEIEKQSIVAIEKYKDSNGFTDKNKEFVTNIKETIQNMRIDAFFSNKESFLN